MDEVPSPGVDDSIKGELMNRLNQITVIDWLRGNGKHIIIGWIKFQRRSVAAGQDQAWPI